MRLSRGAAAAFLLASGATALAQQAVRATPEKAAEQVAAALRAGDGEALRALAAADAPDPWLTADALLSRGEAEAARAFAAAAPRPDTASLPSYLGRRAGVRDASARKALRDALVALREKRPADALEAASRAGKGEDTVVTVRVAQARAFALRDLGRTAEAVEAFAEAAAAAGRTGWLRRAAEALDEAAFTARRRWDYGTAIRLREGQLEAERARGNPLGEARAMGNLGLVLEETGEYARALAMTGRALDLFVKAGDREGAATARNNLALLYGNVGDMERWLEEAGKAVAARRELGDRRGTAASLCILAAGVTVAGDGERGLALFREALAIQGEEGDLEGAAATVVAMALAHGEAGQYAESLALMQQAILMARAAGDRTVEAWCTLATGNAFLGLGKWEEAADAYRRGSGLSEGFGIAEGRALALGGMAAALAHMDRKKEAVAAARESVAALTPVLAGFAEEQGYYARSGYRLSGPLVGYACAFDLRDAGAALFFLESTRAGTLLETLRARESMHAAALPPALLAEEIDARARESSAAASYREAVSAGRAEEAVAAQASLESCRERSRRVIERIQLEAKGAAALVLPRPDDLGTTRARLAEGEALVLYSVAEELPPGPTSKFVSRHFPHRTSALVITREDARLVPLGPTAAITTACSALAAADDAVDPGPAAEDLRRRILDPLGLGPGIRRLLVSPEGALSYVPFSLLAPGLEIAMVPSATTWGVLLGEGALRGEGVLALGDPEPGGARGDRVTASLRGGDPLERLPGSAEEAKAAGTVVLLGADASEPRLRRELAKRPRWRSVHFACHGLLNAERPVFSSLALTPSEGEDGFLTVLDVFRMKCPADLVVLSACETGRGKARGEGVMGLARGFMFAGSPRIIVSLWKVDDEATRALMARFYALWNAGRGAAGALREAQAHVAAQPKWRHPRYWAAWVLWGLPE